MNLSLSEEQRLLRDSVQGWIGKRYDLELRQANAASANGWGHETWREMADMGWLALALPQAHGGLGGGAVDLSLLMEGLGRGLVVEPYVSTVLLGAALIAGAGSEVQRQTLLPAVAGGDRTLAFAHLERTFAGHPPTQAVAVDDGWRLDGRKSVVLNAATADQLVVSARVRGPDGISDPSGLFLVPAGAPGVRRRDYPMVDGRRASDVEFEDVRLDASQRLGNGADDAQVVDEVLDRANAALLADSVGCMQALLDATIDYAKARRQFSRPIADSQVLRHRMVRMAIACEEARSMALLASLRADAAATERARAVSAAKVKVVACGRFVSEQAVQIHGAIGLTEELVVGAYFKRLLANESLFGTAEMHQRRYETLAPFAVPATSAAAPS